jgi:circadian clock protein KaiB
MANRTKVLSMTERNGARLKSKPVKQRPKRKYILKLFITGQTPRSAASVTNLNAICNEYLTGRFELEVVDIYQQPEMARDSQIVAAPTLIKQLPPPLRKLVGDLSDRGKVLMGLNINEDWARGDGEAESTS